MLTHQIGLLSRDYISALRVLSPQIFTRPTTPKLYFQLYLGRLVASSWALPHISSLYEFVV